jgi:hypothetical protein
MMDYFDDERCGDFLPYAVTMSRTKRARKNSGLSLVSVNKDFVRARLLDAVVHEIKVDIGKIANEREMDKWVDNLWRATLQFAEGYQRPVTQSSYFLAFPERARALVDFFGPKGVSGEDLARAAKIRVDLLYKDTSKIQEKYRKHLPWLSYIGMSPQESVKLMIKWPAFFSYENEALYTKFCMALALTKTPLFAFRHQKKTFESCRRYLLWDRFVPTTLDPKNYMLRKAYAEICPTDVPSTAIIHSSIPDNEAKIANGLGLNVDERNVVFEKPVTMPLPVSSLTKALHDYGVRLAGSVQRDMRTMEPDQLPSILPVLMPEGYSLKDEGSRNRLWTRMIVTGLVRNYSLVSVNRKKASPQFV